jgi:integrase
MRQKLIILPKLCSCNSNPLKQWFVYYSCRDPQTGKMVRFRHYDGFTGLSFEEKLVHAQNVIDQYGSKLRTGWSPFTDDTEVVYNDHVDYKTVADLYGTRRGGNRTIRVWISKFLERLQPAVSLATYQTYQSKFRIFIHWLTKEKIEGNDLATFDSKLIGLFFNYLINSRKLSKISIRSYSQILKALFEYLKFNKLILINPVYDIPLCNRINDQAPRPIQRADIDIFKKELIKDPTLWLAVQLEFYCALRPGHEIREMKIKDIDFSAGTIRVDRTRAKSRVQRIVTIPHQLLIELRTLLLSQKYNRELYVFGRAGKPGSVPYGKNTLRGRFNQIRERLNMPNEYKFYSWKHTGLIEADETGKISSKDICQHAGHVSLQTTDFYFRNKRVGTSKAIRDNYPTL